MSRFFIEHGMIHDRVTGRHVTTDRTLYEMDENNNPILNKPVLRQSDIIDCCALLNALADNQRKPLEEEGCVHCNSIKRRKILGDPMEGVTFPTVKKP